MVPTALLVETVLEYAITHLLGVKAEQIGRKMVDHVLQDVISLSGPHLLREYQPPPNKATNGGQR